MNFPAAKKISLLFASYCCLAQLFPVFDARETFSHVQDIVKLDVTETTAKFDLHCSPGSKCRFYLIDEYNGKYIEKLLHLQPKWGYQSYTFNNLQPYRWYQIKKVIVINDDHDGMEKLIEMGRFRTMIPKPNVPIVNGFVCLDSARTILVRWQRPSMIYPKSIYSYQLIWWEMINEDQVDQSEQQQQPNKTNQESMKKSIQTVNITRDIFESRNSIDPFVLMITNLNNKSKYQVQIKLEIIEDDAEQQKPTSPAVSKSDVSPIETFSCTMDQGDNWLKIIVYTLIIISAITTIIIMIIMLAIRKRYYMKFNNPGSSIIGNNYINNNNNMEDQDKLTGEESVEKPQQQQQQEMSHHGKQLPTITESSLKNQIQESKV